MTRIIPLLIAAVALVASACGSGTVDVAEPGVPSTSQPGPITEPTAVPEPLGPMEELAAELTAARERWAASGLTDYVLTWQPSCFCPMVTITDTVMAGEVVSHEVDGEALGSWEPATMEDLFDRIGSAIDDDVAEVRADFDQQTGAVTSYYVDVDELTADEEYGVTVNSVEPITTSQPGGPALDASALTVDHPCGFGFAKGSADQTLGLVVFFTGEWSEEGPPLDEPIEFGPDSDWTGRISVGADLFANWCDDVVEEGEPVPRVDQELEIVSGTLVGEVDGNFAEGLLTDLVAAPAAGGGIVEWAEVEVRNEGWGFFAG